MDSVASVNSVVLNSWKEIASYVGRGVRTVQRWESDLGMPVRRPRAKSRSAVVAMSDEIDRWLRSAPTSDILEHPRTLAAMMDLRKVVVEHTVLRDRCEKLRLANHQALTTLVVNLKTLHEVVEESRKARLKRPRDSEDPEDRQRLTA